MTASLGVVYTPPWLVERLTRRTLGPLLRSARRVTSLRVLDPACGEGAFLLGACEALLARCRRGGADPGRAAAAIAARCVHGVDLDAAALARARAALAGWVEARSGRPARASLQAALARNLQAGDALLDLDWRGGDHGLAAVLARGGFDAVLGNPPYVALRGYRGVLPALAQHLRDGTAYEITGEGKPDLSLAFLELGASLLRPGGRLGFLIQSRFFRADYGRAARRWLLDRRLLAEIEDYGEAHLFPGRTTYTAAVVLAPGSRVLRHRSYADLEGARRGRPAGERRLRLALLDDEPWCFEEGALAELHRELTRRHGAMGEHRELEISVGLQVSCGRLYQLEPIELSARRLRAVNGLGEEVVLERAAVRPLCRNRGFYPLRCEHQSSFVLFPYRVEGETVRELRWPELTRRFPLAAAYLAAHREVLGAAVALAEGEDRWHLYRYPKNLLAGARAKVLFPTTVEDTVAGVDAEGGVYADNVRVCTISAPFELRALAAVLSSTVFSALARLRAGLSDGGWRQLNRQFLALAPLPLAALREPRRLAPLTALAEELQSLQEEARARGELRAEAAAALELRWTRLDALAEELYGLDAGARALLRSHPRRVARSELLRRHLEGRPRR